MARGADSGGRGLCALRKGCENVGTAKCRVCPIPDERGRALCPRCRAALSFLRVKEQRALWGCSNLPGRGCGATVAIPRPGSGAAEGAE